jgi:glycine cleavage system transcriptional repressor
MSHAQPNQQHGRERRLITVTGADRPGLVAAVSGILAEEGADIEDVSMTRLSGNFATILLARGGDLQRLSTRLGDLGRERGLNISVGVAVEDDHVEADPNFFIHAAGPNRVGIVAALSEVLARYHANITEMTTRLLSRTEVPIYLVRIDAAIPSNWDEVERDIREVGVRLGIEVRVEPIERTDL